MRRAVSMLIAGATLASVMLGPVPGLADCEPVPAWACDRLPSPQVPVDGNVVVRDRAFDPASVTARLGTSVYFHNLDPWPHTVTHTGCVDGKQATPCLFNSAIRVNGVGYFATRLAVDRRFSPNQTYRFVCTIHDGMAGELTVL